MRSCWRGHDASQADLVDCQQLPPPPAQAGPNAPRARPLSTSSSFPPGPAAPQAPLQPYSPPSAYSANSPMPPYDSPQSYQQPQAPPSPYPPTSYATPRPASYQAPQQQHPVPPPQFQYAPAPVPQVYQSPAEIAAAKYHAELVAYYLSFAMQAVVAPAEDERQTRCVLMTQTPLDSKLTQTLTMTFAGQDMRRSRQR